MASPEPRPWCHRHSQNVGECIIDLSTEIAKECAKHANDPHYNPALDLPVSPFGPVDQAAIEFFNVYETNVRAGFTPPQALYLLAVQMVGSPGVAPGVDLPEPPTAG